ncbi:MAG: hypothetical protein NT051_03675 [Candidatus Micrarchaeota archaeon]|nr:hypothetical protein [Candidatus Micrarchaeota archaeon]
MSTMNKKIIFQNIILQSKKNANLLLYITILICGLAIPIVFWKISDPIQILTLALVLIGVFDIIESNRATAIAAKEAELKETPLIFIEPELVTIQDPSKNNEIGGLRPAFIINNVGVVPVQYEISLNDLKVEFGGTVYTQHNFNNNGGYIGPTSKSTFFLNYILASKHDIETKFIGKKNQIAVNVRYWSAFKPQKKYMYPLKVQLIILAIANNVVSMQYFKTTETVAEYQT